MKSGGGKKAAPPPTGSSPWLVYYDGKNPKNQTFCCNVSSSQVKSYRKSIPALHDKKVLSCSHGWLILYDCSRKRLSLCNSTTFDTMPLPSVEWQLNQSTIDSVILIPSSDSNSLKVLVFFEDIQSVFWCKIGDDEWGEISYLNQLKACLLGYCSFSFLRHVISCGHKIYARVCHGQNYGCGHRYEPSIFSMEIVEEPFGLGSISSMRLPYVWGTRNGSFTYVYLLACFDELFCVNLNWGGMRSIESLVVKVQRYDGGRWKSLKGAKDRAFFLSESYSLSGQESGGGRIYFTKDESLYCYNMEDDSVSVSRPCPDLPASQLSSPIWIMPKALAANIVEDDVQCIQGNDGITALAETSCPKEDMGENGLLLEKLGIYILQHIINQLTPLDYMNFLSASRGCRLVAPLADWRRCLSGSSKRLVYPFPLLMFAVDQTDESGLMYKFMDLRIKNNYYMMRVTESFGDGKALIHYSNHGWLLTSTGSHIRLQNPFTRSVINIAPRLINENENLCFTSVGADCLIISTKFIPRFRRVTGITVSTISPGEGEWRVEELRSNKKFNATRTSPVQFQDAFFYLDHNGNIGKLKLEEGNNVSWRVLDQPHITCKAFHPNFLVECGGQLLSVCVGRAGVAVYKLDHGELAWESVTSLGNYAIYLSRSSSFSVLTTSPGLRNRIYFPCLHGSSGIVCFSLETGKWHSSGSVEPLSGFDGARFQLNSCWITSLVVAPVFLFHAILFIAESRVLGLMSIDSWYTV